MVANDRPIDYSEVSRGSTAANTSRRGTIAVPTAICRTMRTSRFQEPRAVAGTAGRWRYHDGDRQRQVDP